MTVRGRETTLFRVLHSIWAGEYLLFTKKKCNKVGNVAILGISEGLSAILVVSDPTKDR